MNSVRDDVILILSADPSRNMVSVDVKVKESAACRRGQTDMPAYDVFVRERGAMRGRHVFTVVYFL